MRRGQISETEFTHVKATGIDLTFWRDFVIPVIRKRDGHKCVKCGTKENLITHHKSYSIDISINDLETWCRKCHVNYHLKKRRKGVK